MTKTTTLDEIYAAINPLPAMLAEKGKASPSAEFRVDANAGISVMLRYHKAYAVNDWENEYQFFAGDDFAKALAKALAFIDGLPSAEQAKLHNFMGKLGSIIDAARDDGIEVAYLNPLVETMKRLSENVITHQPKK
jgi:hypothetical protein